MTEKRHAIVANFEARSVALIASWTLAGAALAQGAPAPAPTREGRHVSTQVQKAETDRNGPIRPAGPQAGIRD
jgi:hypothetical protein